MYHKHGPETSHEERGHRRMQIVYARKTRERRTFMEDLKEFRKLKDQALIRKLRDSIGPKWYQVLSVPQRKALDTLESSIYQDLLEGRPVRTASIMRVLGLFPRPNNIDLMNCIYKGRDDPKLMLAELFSITYGHTVDGKQASYTLNARLMLSAILYLGLDNLLKLLKERFRPDPPKDKSKHISKPKPKVPLESPYLQEMIAVLYEPPSHKPRPPPPLPNLDDLNEPYEEEPVIPKPPPPPPPPPPPKKRLPISYCEKLAGIMNLQPETSMTTIAMKRVTHTSHRRLRGSKLCLTEVKKTYGLGLGTRKKGPRRKKPVAPSTGLWNAQYLINGVYTINGKTVFVLGSVSILPALGDLIHGGHRYIDGLCVNIHCGFRGRPPPPKPDPCDCLKKWHESVFRYVKSTKCTCGHHYDYGNEGSFLPEELPYFEKPTRYTPLRFNYHTIYDLDAKSLHVEKEFKRIWDTDSVLHVDDGTGAQDKKDKKKKKARKSSTTCLGNNPKPEDYLRCAIRLMRRVNVAARLPDIHLVPELKEWMRRRMFGPYSRCQKADMLRQSTTYWQMITMLAVKGYGHVSPKKNEVFQGHTTWSHKQDLHEKFVKFTKQYKLELFRSQANFNNLIWPSMCQAQFPDKKFREIYFSYLYGRVEDMSLMHPYNSKEVAERSVAMAKRRYVCLPAGVELLDK